MAFRKKRSVTRKRSKDFITYMPFCSVSYGPQAPTVEVKMAWLNELRRILTNQQKLLRGL